MEQEITKDDIQKAIDVLSDTKEKSKKKFNQGLKIILMYLGYGLSALGAVGYLITIIILVSGIGELNFVLIGKDGLFFILNFVFGLWFRTGLYIQGITYGKKENEEVLNAYYKARAKEKRKRRIFGFLRTFEFRMGLAVFINTVFQLLMLAVSSLGVVYLTGFEGIKNWIYFWSAISNLFMFAGFGLLAINSSYEKYVNLKIPIIEQKTMQIIKEREEEERLEAVKMEQERLENERLKKIQEETETLKIKEMERKNELVKEEHNKVIDNVVDDDYVGWVDTTPNV